MTDLESKLAELSARFAARAAAERAALAQDLASGDHAAVQDRAHRIAGIAGMFGQARIGDAALVLERAIMDGADPAGPAAALDRLLAELSA